MAPKSSVDPLQAASIAPTLDPVDAEWQRVDRELKLLQLRELKDSIALRDAHRTQQQRSAEATEFSLAQSREDRDRQKARCSHRKGGNGPEQLFRGSSNYYSINTHVLPDGSAMVICLRCAGVWSRPAPPTSDSRAALEAYAVELVAYQTALSWPTDNTASGGTLFHIPQQPVPTIAA